VATVGCNVFSEGCLMLSVQSAVNGRRNRARHRQHLRK
jgi:hypothetical protein